MIWLKIVVVYHFNNHLDALGLMIKLEDWQEAYSTIFGVFSPSSVNTHLLAEVHHRADGIGAVPAKDVLTSIRTVR